MELGLVRSGIYSVVRLRLESEGVVAVAEAIGALGASVKAEVLVDLEVSYKEEKALQGCGGVGAPYAGANHGRGSFPCSSIRFGEPAGCMVEDDA